jgi:hypothetical protein
LHPHRGQVFADTLVAIQFAGNNHLRRKTMLGTILIFVIASLFCCRQWVPDRQPVWHDPVESFHPDDD